MTMSADGEPRNATVEDYESIVTCLDRCFAPAGPWPGMAALNPHSLYNDPAQMDRYTVIKDGNTVIACLSCVDQTFLIDGDELRVAGIGQVATLPEYRGHGLMSRLLDAAIARITAESFPLSELGGDRVRYGRYGWESAGRQWQFQLTARSVADVPAPSQQVQPLEMVSDEIAAIIAIHETEPLRVRRTTEQYGRLLRRANKQTWLARNAGKTTAYAVAQMSPDTCLIYEFGGTAPGLHAILAHLAASCKELTLWSPWVHPANDLFIQLAQRWHIVSHRMVRVFDLAGALRGFTRQMARRAEPLKRGGSQPVTLEIAESEQAVTLALDADGVRIEPPSSACAKLRLPRRVMTCLLFGPALPEHLVNLPAGCQWLNAVFPLDFMIWRNETT